MQLAVTEGLRPESVALRLDSGPAESEDRAAVESRVSLYSTSGCRAKAQWCERPAFWAGKDSVFEALR